MQPKLHEVTSRSSTIPCNVEPACKAGPTCHGLGGSEVHVIGPLKPLLRPGIRGQNHVRLPRRGPESHPLTIYPQQLLDDMVRAELAAVVRAGAEQGVVRAEVDTLTKQLTDNSAAW